MFDIVTQLTPVSARSDRKSTRLNSSHIPISYAVFCLKKKKTPGIIEHSSTPYSAPPPTTASIFGPSPARRLFRVPAAALEAAPATFAVHFFFKDRATPEIFPLSLPGPLHI